ncbi:hypothetical protein BURKHO8Y_230020 [Burkholderia sp. 8Y]|nr:hypothetical protein BURKHO8Y_230020 [Burkholderia sp. 8Y]
MTLVAESRRGVRFGRFALGACGSSQRDALRFTLGRFAFSFLRLDAWLGHLANSHLPRSARSARSARADSRRATPAAWT